MSSGLITVSCIATDCEKKTEVYSFYILVTNDAEDIYWYTVDGVNTPATEFKV